MSYSSSPSPPLTPPTSDSETEAPSTLPSTARLFTSHTKPMSTPSPHPFAASTKANRAPPSYQKKVITPPATPPDAKKIMSPRSEQAREPKADAAKPTIQRSPSLADSEQNRWEVAISSAVDKAETKLDLSGANLTYIPSSIIDLKNLVVLAKNEPLAATASPRAFIRSTTAPALLPSPHIAGARPFLPSQTTNRLAFGATRQQFNRIMKQQVRNRCEVELYLMRNAIRTLPRELFALDCLVVLSLRQNKLTSLPPAISQLTSLRELNIASNRLAYLPAEIQNLHLASLHLHPNPFIQPPLHAEISQSPRPKAKLRVTTIPAGTLGPLTRRAPVPTLSELVMRYLLTPIACCPSLLSPSRSETRLEAALPLTEIDTLSLPAHIRRILRASTGHGRARVNEDGARVDAERDVSRNVCPSPRHRDVGVGYGKSVRFLREGGVGMSTGGRRDDVRVFGVPVEERMEWVGVVAGVQVAENPGAWVPLLWRGCGQGCLDFLSGEDDIEVEEEVQTFETGRGEGGEEFQFSDDE